MYPVALSQNSFDMPIPVPYQGKLVAIKLSCFKRSDQIKLLQKLLLELFPYRQRVLANVCCAFFNIINMIQRSDIGAVQAVKLILGKFFLNSLEGNMHRISFIISKDVDIIA